MANASPKVEQSNCEREPTNDVISSSSGSIFSKVPNISLCLYRARSAPEYSDNLRKFPKFSRTRRPHRNKRQKQKLMNWIFPLSVSQSVSQVSESFGRQPNGSNDSNINSKPSARGGLIHFNRRHVFRSLYFIGFSLSLSAWRLSMRLYESVCAPMRRRLLSTFSRLSEGRDKLFLQIFHSLLRVVQLNQISILYSRSKLYSDFVCQF